MDPVTIASGVQLAFQFGVALNNYVQDVKGGRGDLQRLVLTINATFDAVRELEELLIENEHTNYWNKYGITRAKKAISDSSFMLSRLGDLVLKGGITVVTKGDDIKTHIDESIFSKLKWPYYKPQIREIQAELVLVKQDVQTSLITYKSGGLPTGMKGGTLKKLQQHGKARLKMMKELQRIRQSRLDNKSNGSSSSDDLDTEDDEMEIQRSFKAEKALLMEWEEAVAEKLRLEQQLQAEEEMTRQKKEQEIKERYIREKQKELQDHLTRIEAQRQELMTMLAMHNVSPNEMTKIADDIIRGVEKDFKGDEFVRKVLATQGMLTGFTNRRDDDKSNEKTSAEPKSKPKSSRYGFKRHAREQIHPEGIPKLLKDDAAPGGLAILSASYFTPDPLGQFKSLEVDPSVVIAQFAKAIATNPQELTLHFPQLPEGCKVAITDQLIYLNSSSSDFHWTILMVEPAFATSNRFFSSRRALRYKPDHLLGAYCVYKRHDKYSQRKGMSRSVPQDDQNHIKQSMVLELPEDERSEQAFTRPPPSLMSLQLEATNKKTNHSLRLPRAAIDVSALESKQNVQVKPDDYDDEFCIVQGLFTDAEVGALTGQAYVTERDAARSKQQNNDTARKLKAQEHRILELETRLRHKPEQDDRYERANETIYDPARARSPILMGWKESGRYSGPRGAPKTREERDWPGFEPMSTPKPGYADLSRMPTGVQPEATPHGHLYRSRRSYVSPHRPKIYYAGPYGAEPSSNYPHQPVAPSYSGRSRSRSRSLSTWRSRSRSPRRGRYRQVWATSSHDHPPQRSSNVYVHADRPPRDRTAVETVYVRNHEFQSHPAVNEETTPSIQRSARASKTDRMNAAKRRGSGFQTEREVVDRQGPAFPQALKDTEEARKKTSTLLGEGEIEERIRMLAREEADDRVTKMLEEMAQKIESQSLREKQLRQVEEAVAKRAAEERGAKEQIGQKANEKRLGEKNRKAMSRHRQLESERERSTERKSLQEATGVNDSEKWTTIIKKNPKRRGGQNGTRPGASDKGSARKVEVWAWKSADEITRRESPYSRFARERGRSPSRGRDRDRRRSRDHRRPSLQSLVEVISEESAESQAEPLVNMSPPPTTIKHPTLVIEGLQRKRPLARRTTSKEQDDSGTSSQWESDDSSEEDDDRAAEAVLARYTS